MKKVCSDELFPQRLCLTLIGLVLDVSLLLFPQSLKLRCDLLEHNRANLIHLQLLLLDQFERYQLPVLIQRCTGCFFHHAQRLKGLHLDHLRYRTLHHQEMRVVHVQLNPHEDVLHFVSSFSLSVHNVL